MQNSPPTPATLSIRPSPSPTPKQSGETGYDKHIAQNPMKRWKARLFYRRTEGIEEEVCELEELDELADIVEAGPHWDTLQVIAIHRINPTLPGLTLEDAQKLAEAFPAEDD